MLCAGREQRGPPMSGSTKFLMFAIALVVAVVGYLVVDRLELMPASRPAPAPVANDPSATKLYADCVSNAFPTQADAERRAVTCSAALQSGQLKPDEIAMARLTRGIARTALGDKALAGEDYIDAVQRY